MDPQKLLKSLEGAVFEIALWVLLLPKTLVQVLRRPVWVLDYTTAELAKPEADRFDDYLPPVSFWLLVAVGPYLWAASVVRQRFAVGEGSADVMSHLPIVNRYLITALLLASAPLSVALIFSLVRRHGITRRALLPHFAAQCYLQSPALLAVMPVVIGLLFVSHAHVIAHLQRSTLVAGFGGLGVVWLVTAETRYLMRDLDVAARRALPIAVASLVLATVVVSGLAVGTIHVLLHAHLMLPHQ
jgi:hypothetical protein